MLHAHIAGTMASDPAERTTTNDKPYVTALVRVPIEGDEPTLVSVIAFDEETRAALGAPAKGDPVSVAGRAKLRSWMGKDREQRFGLSLVAQSVMGGKPQPTRRAPRRRPQSSRDDSRAAAAGFPPGAGDLSGIGRHSDS